METRRLSFEKNPLVPELKDVPAEAKVERLSLPEDIEREISEIPLQRIVERCRAAGVEEDKLEAYKAAFVALLDRPSLAINISSRNGRLNFLPQEYYFAPQVEFGRSGFMSSSYNIPDLLGGGMYKLRAKKSLDGQPDTNPSHHYTEPTGIELLQKFESQGAENQQKKLNGIERYLVRVNRLMYRLHEPFHILQGLVAGDLLNVYKHRFGAEDLVDPQKESELIQAQGQAEELIDKTSDPFPGSHLVIFAPDKDPNNILFSNNEATMDILSEEYIKEELLKHPEFVLWLHNTLSATVKAMREWEKINVAKQEQQADPDFEPNSQTIHLIEEICTLTANAYFAAFPDSAAGESFLKQAKFQVNGKPAEAGIYSMKFGRTDVYNLLEGLKIRGEKKQFSSGESYYDYNRPIDQTGVDTAAEIVSAAIERGWPAEKIEKLFKDINSDTPDPELKKLIETELGITITQGVLEDMEFISQYLYFDDLGDDYPKNLLTRKAIFAKLEKTNPEQNNILIRGMFAQATFKINTEAVRILTGFDMSANDLLQETKLGLFNIDVSQLSREDKQTLVNLHTRYQTDDKLDASYQTLVLSTMVEMARKQKKEAK